MTSNADTEVSALLAELDAEFGKKPGKKAAPAAHKALNQAFHRDNPLVRLTGARGQLDRMRFENYYDWERHRQAIIDGELEQAQAAGDEQLQWLPEAHVTYVINQLCASCKGVCQFVGHEYIRFRGRRRFYRDISGHTHETYPTMLKRVGEVDGNLLAFGIPPHGDPIPDETEELDETVSRCPGCISMEKQALDLWISSTQPSPQKGLELDIDIPLTAEGL